MGKQVRFRTEPAAWQIHYFVTPLNFEIQVTTYYSGGFAPVMPYLPVEDGHVALDFYDRAFCAERVLVFLTKAKFSCRANIFRMPECLRVSPNHHVLYGAVSHPKVCQPRQKRKRIRLFPIDYRLLGQISVL